MREIEDYRKSSDYDIAEIIMSCIAMFLFKEGSRNAYNNDRNEGKFKKNYEKIFKAKLPHADTTDKVMRILAEEELEQLKTSLIKNLLRKKVFYRYRIFGKYLNIAIDATGVTTFTEKHCDGCLHKTSKSGKTTYFHNVLEAKLVCGNGFSLSILTEWIENPSGDYEKQDCEIKAFKRLAARLKKMYPRLPICITGDGLYPVKPVFDICRKNDWRFILTFKDGNLPSVWKEVATLLGMTTDNEYTGYPIITKGERITGRYKWINDIHYPPHCLNWIECLETKQNIETGKSGTNRFVHVTDFSINKRNAVEISNNGRLRWKIENEGFNTQKNGGFKLEHKYSRVNFLAMKNYYQCLQIAHMIVQLLVLAESFKNNLTDKMTLLHIWKCIIGFMIFGEIDSNLLSDQLSCRVQYRY
ncbi:MAG: hypothetical protein GY853_09960 [PVC group bacterium]|nr:hypothetical protein [PVC group bacterium]